MTMGALFAPALFASDGEGINWWGLGSQYAERPALGWSLLTFFIFVGILFYAIRKPLSQYLIARSEQIRSAIEEAKRAKEEADARMREYQTKLSKLDEESARMKAEFIEQGRREKELYQETARKVSAAIASEATETIQAELSRAFAVLRAEASGLAIELAQKEIEERLNRDMESKLYERFSKDVSGPV
jgi:F-type H+-transporting ATPase subunit b